MENEPNICVNKDLAKLFCIALGDFEKILRDCDCGRQSLLKVKFVRVKEFSDRMLSVE